jgi:hypothetical protein
MIIIPEISVLADCDRSTTFGGILFCFSEEGLCRPILLLYSPSSKSFLRAALKFFSISENVYIIYTVYPNTKLCMKTHISPKLLLQCSHNHLLIQILLVDLYKLLCYTLNKNTNMITLVKMT